MIGLNTNLFGTPTNQLPLAGCHTIHHHALFTDLLKIINPDDSIHIKPVSIHFISKILWRGIKYITKIKMNCDNFVPLHCEF